MQIVNYIKDFKFVLWGIGNLGRTFFNSLDEGKVIAIIESNERLIGTEYRGVKVISFEEYLRRYKAYYIIITPMYDKDIIRSIRNQGIKHYFRLLDCPMEFFPFDGIGFDECQIPMPRKDKGISVVVYGWNLYAIALINYWYYKGFIDIKLIIDEIHQTEVDHKLLKDFKLEKSRMYVTELKNNDIVYYAMYGINELETLQNQLKCEVIESYESYGHSKSRVNSSIEKFKDKHKNERCFIVATGPSLTMSDLDKLYQANERCISMNNIMPAFKETKWRPEYYMVADRAVVLELEDKLDHVPIPTKFVTGTTKTFWEKSHDETIYRYNCNYNRSDREAPRFSIDASECLYLGWTITYVCIQMAVYMGFKEIFLLGVDCSGENEPDIKKVHFTDEYYKEQSNVHTGFYQTDRQRVLQGYAKAKEIAEQVGVKIYNATRGGHLEIFERVDFDTLF